MSDHASSSTATQMAQNSVFERFARAGYVVSGLRHLTIGYLAIGIALGTGGGNADQSGALAAVAGKPGGIVALWVAGARGRRGRLVLLAGLAHPWLGYRCHLPRCPCP
jgi:hypothetical protein